MSKRLNFGLGTINLGINGFNSVTVGKRGSLNINTSDTGTYVNYGPRGLRRRQCADFGDCSVFMPVVGMLIVVWAIIDITYYMNIWH